MLVEHLYDSIRFLWARDSLIALAVGIVRFQPLKNRWHTVQVRAISPSSWFWLRTRPYVRHESLGSSHGIKACHIKQHGGIQFG